MIAQYRPDIARVAEETVVNLKEMESRIDVLRSDLASLCTVLGHLAAAQVAVTPARLLPGSLGISPLASTLGFGPPSPYQAVSPFAGAGNPFGAATLFATGSPAPFANPFGSFASPWATPFAGNAIGAIPGFR
jgi:hypothetical protein